MLKEEIKEYGMRNSLLIAPMPTATATKPKNTSLGSTRSLGQSLYASSQSRFATSKLIRNLGSGNDGVQFFFSNGLRTAHGRD